MHRVVHVFLVLGLLLAGGISAAVTQAQSSSAFDLLPDSLPIANPGCLTIKSEGSFDLPSLVDRFAEMPGADEHLAALGWEDGAFRQFVCQPAPLGHVGWFELNVHRFPDAAAAADAVLLFASARALGTRVHNVAAPSIGDARAALAGPSDEGREYTLYVSSGPLLLRVTGVAPNGDPSPEVKVVMQDWLRSSAISGQPWPPPPPAPSPPASEVPALTRYTIEDLGPGLRVSEISEAGQVLLPSGIWDNGTVTDLAAIDVDSVIAFDAHGLILAMQGDQAVIYDPASGSITPVAGAESDFQAVDINASGTVIGRGAMDYLQPGELAEPIVIADGRALPIPVPPDCLYLSLTAINESGEMAGTASGCGSAGEYFRAVVVDGEVAILGGATNRASDLNDRGQVVGDPGPACWDCGFPAPGRAFLFDSRTGTTDDLGTLPGHEGSWAFAVNNLGQVVGAAWHQIEVERHGGVPDLDEVRTAYLYDHRTGQMSDLNDLIPPGSDWRLLAAYDINDAGQIVGEGMIGDELHAFLLTPMAMAAAVAAPTPLVIIATSIPTATASPTPTALPTSTPAPTATPAPAPTATVAPTPSPSPTAVPAATGCQLVELYPGYPGYRGYVAGIDGPGEVACLGDLVARNPRFDSAAEDAANLAAARAIGLTGTVRDWTWENWMAIEAERGLAPTCYSCLFRDLDPSPARESAAWDPTDARLQLGGYGTSEALAQAASGAGMDSNFIAFFEDSIDPDDEDALGADHVLRAVIGLLWPGHHTAPEIRSAYDQLFAMYAEPGTFFFDSGLMWDTVLAQGGYAPTPPTAHLDDQMYMVRTSVEALCVGIPSDICSALLMQYDSIEALFLSELRRAGPDISYAEWLREEFSDWL